MSGNLTSSISNHFPQFLLINNGPVNTALPSKKGNSPVHDWSKFCLDDFLGEIRSLNWDAILQLHADDPSLSFDNFYSTIECLLEKHAPLKKFGNSKKRKKSNPWITKGILTSINKRDHLRKCFLKEIYFLTQLNITLVSWQTLLGASELTIVSSIFSY